MARLSLVWVCKTLYARRQELTESLFRDIESNIDHKLYNLLPPLIEIDTTLRNTHLLIIRQKQTFNYTLSCNNSAVEYSLALSSNQNHLLTINSIF